MSTTQPTDDAYPRYFVHRPRFVPDALFVRCDSRNELVVALPDGTTCDIGDITLAMLLKLTHRGILCEITARDADALLAKANVQRANESTGARRSEA